MQRIRNVSRFGKKLVVILLSLFLLSLMGSHVDAAETVLEVLFPNHTNRYAAGVGTVFSLDVEISNVFDLYGCEILLFFNNTVLNALNMTPYIGTSDMPGFFFPEYMLWKYEINNDPFGNGTGYAWISVSQPVGSKLGMSGSGILATMEFNATQFGTTVLTFDRHILGDTLSQRIAHTLNTGIMTVGEVSKIPVAEADGPYVGSVNVPVTFNASGSYDPQGEPLASYYWDFGDGTNGTFTRAFVDHAYTEVKDYVATLIVTDAENLTGLDTADVQIVVDTTPPTGSMSITGISPYDPTHITNSTEVFLGFSYFDSESGVYQMRISNENATLPSADWITKAGSRSWNLTEGDGIKTVFVQFRDKAGNPSLVYSRSIMLDTTAPTVTITSPSDGSEIKSASVVVDWEGSDGAGSGIHHYEVALDGGEWVSVGTNLTASFNGLAEWGHIVNVKAVDKAGISSSVLSSRFTVNLSLFGGPGYFEEAIVVAVAIAALAGVGVYFFKFRKKT